MHRDIMEPPGLIICFAPKVHKIGATEFFRDLPGAANKWAPNFGGYKNDPELLLEVAGRACYQSWENKAGRTTEDYLQEQIIGHGHTSVLEHASVTFYILGVSRSLTHELVRHRAGCAYSQLSQRYVDSSDVAFVQPPDLATGSPEYEVWVNSCHESLVAYSKLVDGLPYSWPVKKRRQLARSVLPNCVETHIVMTANFRAWRHIITMRTSEAADSEIRRLMKLIHNYLVCDYPSVFEDLEVS